MATNPFFRWDKLFRVPSSPGNYVTVPDPTEASRKAALSRSPVGVDVFIPVWHSWGQDDFRGRSVRFKNLKRQFKEYR